DETGCRRPAQATRGRRLAASIAWRPMACMRCTARRIRRGLRKGFLSFLLLVALLMDSQTTPAYANLHRGRFELQVLLHDVIEKINQEPTVGLDAEQVTFLWLLVVLWTSHNLSRWERVCEARRAPASAFPSSGRPLILSAVRLRRCLCGTFRNCFCAVCLLPVSLSSF
ncbi:MAG: hypothetical protein ACPIOQ_20785, partial [Promethearchaeia archaeon]